MPNQLFNWQRALAASAKGRGGLVGKASTRSLAACSAEMVPVGVVVSTSNDGLALAPVSIGGIGPLDQHATRYPPDEHAGLIAIDLVCGTRLRVHMFRRTRATARVVSDQGVVVISVVPGTKVYLACQPVSMRLGFDGLAARVSQFLLADPFSNQLFLFGAKRVD